MVRVVGRLLHRRDRSEWSDVQRYDDGAVHRLRTRTTTVARRQVRSGPCRSFANSVLWPRILMWACMNIMYDLEEASYLEPIALYVLVFGVSCLLYYRNIPVRDKMLMISTTLLEGSYKNIFCANQLSAPRTMVCISEVHIPRSDESEYTNGMRISTRSARSPCMLSNTVVV